MAGMMIRQTTGLAVGLNGILRAAALLAMLPLAGCGSIALFGKYDVPESPEVAAAPWPQLVDVPAALPPGSYGPSAPDPAIGVATQAALSRASAEAIPRATTLSQPVIDPATREKMLARAQRAR